jgi:hypothetical protein
MVRMRQELWRNTVALQGMQMTLERWNDHLPLLAHTSVDVLQELRSLNRTMSDVVQLQMPLLPDDDEEVREEVEEKEVVREVVEEKEVAAAVGADEDLLIDLL